MIDTIRFKIPILSNNDAIYQALNDRGTSIRKTVRGERIFEKLNDHIELGSWYRNIAVKSNSPTSLTIEFSAPKYKNGHNIHLLYPSGLPEQVKLIYEELCSHYRIKFAPPELWEIVRLDICYNWKLESEELVSKVLQSFTGFQFPRKTRYPQKDGSLYFVSDYSTFKMYAKHPEFIKHDYKELFDSNSPKTDKLNKLAEWGLQESIGVLRVEIELRSKAVKEEFNCNSVSYNDILNIQDYYNIINKYLYKLTKLDNNNTIMHSNEVLERLESKYSKTVAINLYNFFKSYTSVNPVDNYAVKRYPKPTYYRYLKMLRDADISLINLDNYFDSFKLSVPSDSVTNRDTADATLGGSAPYNLPLFPNLQPKRIE